MNPVSALQEGERSNYLRRHIPHISLLPVPGNGWVQAKTWNYGTEITFIYIYIYIYIEIYVK